MLEGIHIRTPGTQRPRRARNPWTSLDSSFGVPIAPLVFGLRNDTLFTLRSCTNSHFPPATLPLKDVKQLCLSDYPCLMKADSIHACNILGFSAVLNCISLPSGPPRFCYSNRPPIICSVHYVTCLTPLFPLNLNYTLSATVLSLHSILPCSCLFT